MRTMESWSRTKGAWATIVTELTPDVRRLCDTVHKALEIENGLGIGHPGVLRGQAGGEAADVARGAP